ncbi:unnamed protein product [Blepharisma stoltei]|uniref:Uncharacterized protein n=1 Tax=Blepharisma stoltei TaxID=1481888 RepID=A0AAU9JBI0_9CILI|nr:unnamed protein product [Blepharisma stoltei]
MELILRTEILYKSPEIHQIVRQKLLKCTENIVKKCNPENLDTCVDEHMAPCREFKLQYESKRNELLDKIKKDMLSSCLNSEDKESCKRRVVESNISEVDKLLEFLQRV